MSGGSYNYLCRVMDLADLLAGKIDDLEEMGDALARLGYAEDAAAETRGLLADIRAARTRTEVALSRLAPVWKAVEWWVDCDWTEDAVHDALTAYRGGVPAGRRSYFLTPDEVAAVDAMRSRNPERPEGTQ